MQQDIDHHHLHLVELCVGEGEVLPAGGRPNSRKVVSCWRFGRISSSHGVMAVDAESFGYGAVEEALMRGLGTPGVEHVA